MLSEELTKYIYDEIHLNKTPHSTVITSLREAGISNEKIVSSFAALGIQITPSDNADDVKNLDSKRHKVKLLRLLITAVATLFICLFALLLIGLGGCISSLPS